MAIYNEILSARFSRLCQKLFSMKGPAAVKQLSGEILPVLPLFIGKENRFLEGWNTFGVFNNPAAAGAGNFNQFRLRNPSNSGVLAVIEKLAFIAVTAPDTMVLSHSALGTDLTTVFSLSQSLRLDSRGAQSSALIASTSNTTSGDLAGLLTQESVAVNVTGDVILTEDQELPLLPGDAYQVRQSVANQSCSFILWWRERALEESEKQF